jgi:2-C-methyl-D-erythritol 4-phosphate cytidylyltransferase
MGATSSRQDSRSVVGLLAAAGGGVRLGGRPKAFLRHRGRTMLEHGVAYLLQAADTVLAGLPAERLDEGRALLAETPTRCFAGGASKQDTVARLIVHCDADLVVVHDASQFMPRRETLMRVLSALADSDADAVIPTVALPVRGSLALRDGEGWMTAPLDRERVVMSHTPQAYRRAALAAALDHAAEQGWQESGLYALIQRRGGRVRLIDGDADQLKLTYPQDLAVLEEEA